MASERRSSTESSSWSLARPIARDRSSFVFANSFRKTSLSSPNRETRPWLPNAARATEQKSETWNLLCVRNIAQRLAKRRYLHDERKMMRAMVPQ